MKNIFYPTFPKATFGLCVILMIVANSSLAQLTRAQIMSTANTYTNSNYSWTATNSNKWNGVYCGGRYVYYAPWVIAGTNWGMPYCWGAFSSITQHNTAMSGGKSAGDICSGSCSGNYAGLNCASGLDCSGFVSKAWQLTSKLSCSGLNTISTKIAASTVDWGDIYNRTSDAHVRLVNILYTNGNVDVLESSKRDNNTSHFTYTPNQLSTYEPRIYNKLYNECASPITLVVGNSCTNILATNVDATASTPAPVGGCPTSSYKDVWFKFKMPNVSNPFATIRTTAGTMTDAVMEVYSGSTCSNKTYITCEDNNSSPGNGSSMPVINLQGGPNNTIWVRVWGKNGSTGTFNICVLNYTSNNFTNNGGDSRNTISVPSPNEQFEITQRSSTDKLFIKDADDLLSQLLIKPNPSKDLLTISFSQSEVYYVHAIVLRDFLGKIILFNDLSNLNSNEISEQLDVTNFASGIYILQILTARGIISEKVVIAH